MAEKVNCSSRYFLDNCEAAASLCSSVPDLSTSVVDELLVTIDIMYDTDKETLVKKLGSKGVQTLDVFVASDAAKNCATCEYSKHCRLGKYLVDKF